MLALHNGIVEHIYGVHARLQKKIIKIKKVALVPIAKVH